MSCAGKGCDFASEERDVLLRDVVIGQPVVWITMCLRFVGVFLVEY